MLANRLPGILPDLSEDEALESAAMESLGQSGFNPENWMRRPFRAPHHNASGAALIGGGSIPRPGEISLAHNGVLFLDELPEFDRKVLEALREPLESGVIHISRVAQRMRYLANFLLVAACNPCPCGYLNDGADRCRCTRNQVPATATRLSGPLLDRIDIQIEVPRMDHRLFRRPQNTQEAAKRAAKPSAPASSPRATCNCNARAKPTVCCRERKWSASAPPTPRPTSYWTPRCAASACPRAPTTAS